MMIDDSSSLSVRIDNATSPPLVLQPSLGSPKFPNQPIVGRGMEVRFRRVSDVGLVVTKVREVRTPRSYLDAVHGARRRQWKYWPESMTIVWPVMVSVRHRVTTKPT
jgi:hypothetical protein